MYKRQLLGTVNILGSPKEKSASIPLSKEAKKVNASFKLASVVLTSMAVDSLVLDFCLQEHTRRVITVIRPKIIVRREVLDMSFKCISGTIKNTN